MKIWRGDQDQHNIRQLQFTVKTCDGLYSTLINSGNPAALSQQGFVSSIQKHAHGNWSTSHFLSFSKNKSVATGFAVGTSGKTLAPSSQSSWDTLIACIDLHKLRHIGSVAVGIDHFEFQEIGRSQNLIHLQFPYDLGFGNVIDHRRAAGIPTTRNIWTVDVHLLLTYLNSNGVSVSPAALATSLKEEEVLVLPVDPFWGGAGLTAQVDFGCVASLEYFHLI